MNTPLYPFLNEFGQVVTVGKDGFNIETQLGCTYTIGRNDQEVWPKPKMMRKTTFEADSFETEIEPLDNKIEIRITELDSVNSKSSQFDVLIDFTKSLEYLRSNEVRKKVRSLLSCENNDHCNLQQQTI